MAGPTGRKSVAHGVSRGDAFPRTDEPQSGERFVGKSSAAPRLNKDAAIAAAFLITSVYANAQPAIVLMTSLQPVPGFNLDGFELEQPHQAWLCAAGLRDMFPFGVVHFHLRRISRL